VTVVLLGLVWTFTPIDPDSGIGRHHLHHHLR
jgi:hypothetical protein